MTVRDQSGEIDFDAGTASGDQPVAGQAPFGTITGQGFRIVESGENVFVNGPAQMLVQPGAKTRLP